MNDSKSLLKRLFKGKSHQTTPTEPQFILRQRTPNPDELALGFAVGFDEKEKKEVIQLKGIAQTDRDTHFYVVGGSGTGKSKFLTTLIIQDIENRVGFGVIDPHGDLIEEIKKHLVCILSEDELRERVVLIDPTLKNQTTTFNPLEAVAGIEADQQAERLIDVFKKIWAETWGNRMENILRHSFIVLCENNLTLLELPRFLTDDEFRHRVLEKTKNFTTREYFNQQFNRLKLQTQHEWSEPVLNRVYAVLSDKRVRHIFASARSSFDPRDVMDNKKILLVKLAQGELGGAGDLLGALLISKIQMAAFTRSEIPQESRVPFYFYIDEFQNFATKSFIDTLSQARKYRFSLILSHQYLTQLPREMISSVLTNCAIQVYFRISREDANILAKESMSPIYRQPPGWELYIQQLQELPARMCYIKNKNLGGVIRVETKYLLPPHEFYNMDAAAIEALVKRGVIGEAYLDDRDAIEAEYQLRWRELGLVQEAEKDWESFAEPEK